MATYEELRIVIDPVLADTDHDGEPEVVGYTVYNEEESYLNEQGTWQEDECRFGNIRHVAIAIQRLGNQDRLHKD